MTTDLGCDSCVPLQVMMMTLLVKVMTEEFLK